MHLSSLAENIQFFPTVIFPPPFQIALQPITVPSPILVVPSLATTNLQFSSILTLFEIINLPLSLVLKSTSPKIFTLSPIKILFFPKSFNDGKP